MRTIIRSTNETCGDEAVNIVNDDEIFALVALLKTFTKEKNLYKGRMLHADAKRRGLLERSPHLASALITMYCKCGVLDTAHQVLQELRMQNIVVWNALIAGYTQVGHNGEALNCFEQMLSECVSPDAVTFICILRACGNMRAIDKGKQIHNEIVNRGLLKKDIVVGNALMDMYVKCGMIGRARQVLEEIPEQDVISWSTIISGHVHQGQGPEALGCFEEMQTKNLFPNAVTFISTLKACAITQAIDKGRNIHDEIVRRGLLEKNIALGTALVDMYAKCGVLMEAQQVTQKLPLRNEVAWSALIAGYAKEGQGHLALNCFEQMQNEGFSADIATFVAIVSACSSIGAVESGLQIHREISCRGLLRKDLKLGNAIVDMYAKCGLFAKAHEVLEELPIRDIFSWNTLISGYAQHGQCQDAFSCLMQMRAEGISPDMVTFISILIACGSAGAIDLGKEIHEEISNKGWLEKSIVLGNALVDMYAKCGYLTKAQLVVEELPVQNISSWNSLIAGYAQQGQGHDALQCFEQLQRKGLAPNSLTFICLLSACSHSGLLDEARILYGDANKKYGVILEVEHHTCMVVNFGYSGHFDMAVSIIKVMPFCQYLEVWLALLSVCRKWGNVKLGRLAFDQAMQLDCRCTAAYSLMTNIFEAVGMQEDANRMRDLRVKYAS